MRLGKIAHSDLLFGWLSHYLEIPDYILGQSIHVLGLPRSGKSRLLGYLVNEAIDRGWGVLLIDPHGPLHQLVRDRLIARGTFDNPYSYQKYLILELEEDGDWSFDLNMIDPALAARDGDIAGTTIETFMRAFSELEEVGASNFKRLMDASIKVLVANSLPIVCLQDLVNRKDYRLELLKKVSDYSVRSYFINEYDHLTEYQRQDQSRSTLSRAYDLVSSPLLLRCFGARTNKIDWDRALRDGTVTLAHLGKLSRKSKGLMGAYFSHSLQRAAMRRAPETHLRPFMVILDEFSIFVSNSAKTVEEVLAELPKYGVSVKLAHQVLTQLDSRRTRDLNGALQNCPIRISFRVGPEDAPIMAKVFAEIKPDAIRNEEDQRPSYLSSTDQLAAYADALMKLENRHALVRIEGGKTYEIETMDVPDVRVDPQRVTQVMDTYHNLYYTHKKDIVLPFDRSWEAKAFQKNRGSP